MSEKVVDIANSIWVNQLNQSSSTTIPEIAFWIRNHGIGALNSLIFTSYLIGSDQEITPSTFGADESAILSQLYILKFIQFQIDSLIGASACLADNIVEYSEKGHTIRKFNRNEVSRSWITLKEQAKKNLNDLIGSYKINRSTPRQLVGIDASLLLVDMPRFNRVLNDGT